MTLTRDQYRRIRLQQRKRRRIPGGIILHYLINVRSHYDARPYPEGWSTFVKHKEWFFDFYELRRHIDQNTPNYRQPNFSKTKTIKSNDND